MSNQISRSLLRLGKHTSPGLRFVPAWSLRTFATSSLPQNSANAVAADRTYKNCHVKDLLSLKGNTTVITGATQVSVIAFNFIC